MTKTPLVNQRDARPTRKWQFMAIGSGISVTTMFAIAIFAPEAYERIPPGFETAVGGMIAAVFGLIFGYQAKDRHV